MSKKSDCWDNAVAENFFAALKKIKRLWSSITKPTKNASSDI
jgi:transposase InsO family protein